MFSMVYASSASLPFSKPELVSLLEKSRRNNKSLDVTGMLLYKDGNFLQVLEGEEQIVKTLYAKIGADSRHKGVLVLFGGHEPGRQFPDWSMGFRDLTSPQVAAIPGYSDFLNVELTAEELSSHPNRTKKLLSLFKKNM